MDGTVDEGPLVASQAAGGGGRGRLLAANRRPFSRDLLWNVWNQYFHGGWLSYSSLAVRPRVSPATWLWSSGDVLCFHPTRTHTHSFTFHALEDLWNELTTFLTCWSSRDVSNDRSFLFSAPYLITWVHGDRSAIKILIVQRKREKYFFTTIRKNLSCTVRWIKDKNKTFPRGTFQKTKETNKKMLWVAVIYVNRSRLTHHLSFFLHLLSPSIWLFGVGLGGSGWEKSDNLMKYSCSSTSG